METSGGVLIHLITVPTWDRGVESSVAICGALQNIIASREWLCRNELLKYRVAAKCMKWLV